MYTMRVYYRSKSGSPVYEQTAPVKFCCVEMCRWWDVLIGFGVVGHDRSTSKEVNLCMPRAQANGRILAEVVPVEFCPWCGEPVKACRKE